MLNRRHALTLLVRGVALGLAAGGALPTAARASTPPPERVRVATFNVMNYLCMNRVIDGRFAPRYPKPEAEKSAVRAVLHEVDVDIVCLQEVGPQPFLDELQQDLAREGRVYPHAILLESADPLRHVAVLSRLPVREIVRHDAVTFSYLDRTEQVKRGMLEVGFDGPAGPWRIFVLHLKSRLTEEAADPGAEQRRAAEARALRDVILARSAGGDALHLIAGDLNATTESRTLSALTRRGKRVVAVPLPAADSRGETWTHRHAAADRYERIDYLLASPALLGRIEEGRATIHDGPAALQGSDHRLVWTTIDWSLPAPISPHPDESGPAEAPPTETPAGT